MFYYLFSINIAQLRCYYILISYPISDAKWVLAEGFIYFAHQKY